MGSFAETADVNYRLSFADQGKQIFPLCFQYMYIEMAVYTFVYTGWDSQLYT
jgi:hypothetical protein